MLSIEEQKELEELSQSEAVKVGRRSFYNPEKQRLYTLRYLHKRGEIILARAEALRKAQQEGVCDE